MKASKRNIQRLIRGAMGEIKADLIIAGGEMVKRQGLSALSGPAGVRASQLFASSNPARDYNA